MSNITKAAKEDRARLKERNKIPKDRYFIVTGFFYGASGLRIVSILDETSTTYPNRERLIKEIKILHPEKSSFFNDGVFSFDIKELNKENFKEYHK